MFRNLIRILSCLSFSKPDMSRLRLAAGSAIVKLAQEPCYHEIITLEQYQLCALAINVRKMVGCTEHDSLCSLTFSTCGTPVFKTSVYYDFSFGSDTWLGNMRNEIFAKPMIFWFTIPSLILEITLFCHKMRIV